MNHFTMNVANVGDTEAVLCRRGEATMLTRRFIATHDRDECLRICQFDGMITEVNV
jgi:serine/threonine protein phosphatase PrpC